MQKENNIYTKCPHCQTVFRTASAHLNIANGHVRCSRCRSVFNALHHLLKESPQRKAEQTQKMSKINAEISEMNAPDLPNEDIYKSRSFGSFLGWGLTIIVMTTLLFGQIVWLFQRELVLQHTEIRPWLVRFCDILLCDLPQTRSVTHFQIEKHFMQLDPTVKNALQIDATFSNSATFPQPYPKLELTFEKTENMPVARRVFTPSEYMQRNEITEEIAPSGSVHVRLKLVDMSDAIEGDKIVQGYKFRFL